jgi:hypothetical protein
MQESAIKHLSCINALQGQRETNMCALQAHPGVASHVLASTDTAEENFRTKQETVCKESLKKTV